VETTQGNDGTIRPAQLRPVGTEATTGRLIRRMVDGDECEKLSHDPRPVRPRCNVWPCSGRRRFGVRRRNSDATGGCDAGATHRRSGRADGQVVVGRECHQPTGITFVRRHANPGEYRPALRRRRPALGSHEPRLGRICLTCSPRTIRRIIPLVLEKMAALGTVMHPDRVSFQWRALLASKHDCSGYSVRFVAKRKGPATGIAPGASAGYTSFAFGSCWRRVILRTTPTDNCRSQKGSQHGNAVQAHSPIPASC
jgi:hypothetical protein